MYDYCMDNNEIIPTSDIIRRLPNEMLWLIFVRLSLTDIARLRQVSKYIKTMCDSLLQSVLPDDVRVEHIWIRIKGLSKIVANVSGDFCVNKSLSDYATHILRARGERVRFCDQTKDLMEHVCQPLHVVDAFMLYWWTAARFGCPRGKEYIYDNDSYGRRPMYIPDVPMKAELTQNYLYHGLTAEAVLSTESPLVRMIVEEAYRKFTQSDRYDYLKRLYTLYYLRWSAKNPTKIAIYRIYDKFISRYSEVIVHDLELNSITYIPFVRVFVHEIKRIEIEFGVTLHGGVDITHPEYIAFIKDCLSRLTVGSSGTN